MSHRSYVKVLTYTWSKDSHGLFDYESPHLFNSNFKITGQGQFYRTNNEIQMLENTTIENDKLAYLFDVQQDTVNKDRYWLISKFGINSNYGLGLVVRGIKKKGLPTGYELQAGDHIKVGRVKFIVREIRDEQGNITKLHADQNLRHYERPLQQPCEGENPNGVICRICLMDDTYPDPVDNTLVSPCKCKGSCEYVHLKCLRLWLDSKKFRVQNGSNVCLAFNYRKFNCEICKDNLPYSILLRGQEIEIVDIKKPEHLPYILLEKIENTRENRGLYLIRGSDEEVQIGRGHTNSILVSDISVSRNHASIIYKDGKFRLFDKNSKFGTLVQLTNPIEVLADKTIIQCGKTVIILSLHREKASEIMTAPKIVEPMEILESPDTPSTTNEYDADSKQLLIESEKPKRKRGRPKKRETAEYSTQVEEPKEESICHVVVNGSEILETKLLLQSKKIFKIVKPEINKLKPKAGIDEAESTVGTVSGRRKGKRRN